MEKHYVTVILTAHEFTNPGETPRVTADQLLSALLKTIQWRFHDTHDEQKLFGVMCALQIEKTSWIYMGKVEVGSGTLIFMSNANIPTIGAAESCPYCSHISHSFYLTLVGKCVLYLIYVTHIGSISISFLLDVNQ